MSESTLSTNAESDAVVTPEQPNLAPSTTAEATTAGTTSPEALPESEATESSEPAPSYVKLAMRNMVRKGGKSLFHFFLTTAGLLGLLVGLAYLTR